MSQTYTIIVNAIQRFAWNIKKRNGTDLDPFRGTEQQNKERFAMHAGTERKTTERFVERNGTERKWPYLDTIGVPDGNDYCNLHVSVRSTTFVFFGI